MEGSTTGAGPQLSAAANTGIPGVAAILEKLEER